MLLLNSATLNKYVSRQFPATDNKLSNLFDRPIYSSGQ